MLVCHKALQLDMQTVYTAMSCASLITVCANGWGPDKRKLVFLNASGWAIFLQAWHGVSYTVNVCLKKSHLAAYSLHWSGSGRCELVEASLGFNWSFKNLMQDYQWCCLLVAEYVTSLMLGLNTCRKSK